MDHDLFAFVMPTQVNNLFITAKYLINTSKQPINNGPRPVRLRHAYTGSSSTKSQQTLDGMRDDNQQPLLPSVQARKTINDLLTPLNNLVTPC